MNGNYITFRKDKRDYFKTRKENKETNDMRDPYPFNHPSTFTDIKYKVVRKMAEQQRQRPQRYKSKNSTLKNNTAEGKKITKYKSSIKKYKNISIKY